MQYAPNLRRFVIIISIALFVVAALVVVFRPVSFFSMFSLDGTLSERTLNALPWLLAVILIGIGIVLLFSEPLLRSFAEILNRLEALPTGTFVVGLIGAALLVRVAWLLLIPSAPYADSSIYHGLACNLASGKGYVNDFSPPEYEDLGKLGWRAPGFPYMLAGVYRITGCDTNSGKILSLVFGVALVYMSYLLSREVFGERIARIAASIVAFFPSLVGSTSLLGTELPFMFFMLLVFWLVVKNPSPSLIRCIVIGLLLGICVLIRPQSLLLILVLPVYFFSVKRNIGRIVINTVLIGAVMFLAVLPWSLRNLQVFGSFVLVTTNGGHLVWEGTQTSGAGAGVEANLDVLCHNLSEPACDNVLRDIAIKNIMADPIGYLRYGLVKMSRFYGFDYENIVQAMESTIEGVDIPSVARIFVMSISEVYYVVVMLLAAAGLFQAFRRGWKPAYNLYLLSILLWTGTHFITQGESRYHMPLLPLFAGFAAATLARVRNVSSEGHSLTGEEPIPSGVGSSVTG